MTRANIGRPVSAAASRRIEHKTCRRVFERSSRARDVERCPHGIILYKSPGMWNEVKDLNPVFMPFHYFRAVTALKRAEAKHARP